MKKIKEGTKWKTWKINSSKRIWKLRIEEGRGCDDVKIWMMMFGMGENDKSMKNKYVWTLKLIDWIDKRNIKYIFMNYTFDQ